MIACPHCGYAHPKHLTSQQCLSCGVSFADLYLCFNNTCNHHQVFQPANRNCRTCQKTLIGEFSGRHIPWGHALYRVREYVGGGGMGEVYRAVEQDQTGTFEREVAIKFNKNVMDQEIIRRFNLEVQILSMLQNPHNIRVYTRGDLLEERATGIEIRAQFMVMELLRGNALNEIVKAGRLPPEQAIPIFIEVCGALAEAHSKDIIHRDLKPHNIMIQTVSGDYFAKVFDFGLSRLTTSMDDRLSASGVVMGTFRYMSPEQALGEDVDQRTDIFSLGVVLYEVLTGRHPFPAENLFELFMLHQNPVSPMEGVEPELAAIITKALYYEKDRRFQSMEEMRLALQVWRGDSISGRVSLNELLKEYKEYQKEAQSRINVSGFQRSLSPSGRHISLPGMRPPPPQPAPSSSKHALVWGGVLGGFLLVFGLGFLVLRAFPTAPPRNSQNADHCHPAAQCRPTDPHPTSPKNPHRLAPICRESPNTTPDRPRSQPNHNTTQTHQTAQTTRHTQTTTSDRDDAPTTNGAPSHPHHRTHPHLACAPRRTHPTACRDRSRDPSASPCLAAPCRMSEPKPTHHLPPTRQSHGFFFYDANCACPQPRLRRNRL